MPRACLISIVVLNLGVPLALSSSAFALCPSGTVASGSTCIDRYEGKTMKRTGRGGLWVLRS
jgi:hypothetical protein